MILAFDRNNINFRGDPGRRLWHYCIFLLLLAMGHLTSNCNCVATNHLSSVPGWLQCNSSEDKSIVNYFGRERPRCEAQRIQKEAKCWADYGDWYYNSTRVIIDDLSLYKPCDTPHYGIHNPCAWMLDGPGLKYDWHPKTNCSIPEKDYRAMDAPDFCELMKGRGPILLVGDSVTELSYFSWHNHIMAKSGVRKCPGNSETPPDTLSCCHNLTIYKVRDDYLSLNGTLQWGSYKNTGMRWTDMIGHFNISIIILNRGSHYTPDDEYIPQMNTTLHYLRTTHPGLHIIWRNTPHGHHLHKNYALAHPLKREKDQPLVYTASEGPWDYGKFYGQNKLMEKLLEKHYPEVFYLDVFNPSILRADSRYDPIHMCVPGPMDTWLELLYNAFILLWR